MTTKPAIVTQLRVPGWRADQTARGMATDEPHLFGVAGVSPKLHINMSFYLPTYWDMWLTE